MKQRISATSCGKNADSCFASSAKKSLWPQQRNQKTLLRSAYKISGESPAAARPKSKQRIEKFLIELSAGEIISRFIR